MNYILEYPQSFLYYSIVFLFSILMAYLGNKTNKKIYLFLLIVTLSLFLGFRSPNTGTDTNNYKIIFEQVTLNNYSYYGYDPGFSILIVIIKFIFKEPQWMFIIFAFLTNLFFILRCWELRQNYNFVLCITIFFTGVYFYSFNIMRQALAIAIIFWATKFLVNKKYILFSIIVAFTCTIHTSALIAFSILFIFMLKDCKSIKLWKVLLYTFVFIVIILIVITINRSFLDLISQYLQRDNKTSGYSTYFTLVIALLLYAYQVFFSKIRTTVSIEDNYELKKIHAYKTYSLLYIIGLLINIILSNFSNASRAAFYLSCFSVLFYSYKYDEKKIKIFKEVFIILSTMKAFYDYLASSNMGLMPYEFFWK